MKTTSRPGTASGLVLLLLLVASSASQGADYSETRFDFKDLSGLKKPTGEWLCAKDVAADPAAPEKLVITPGAGVLVNGAGGRTVNLVTEREFGDALVHVEFCIPKRSNSGVYLMGRYEIQIYDSFGVAKDQYPGIECGGIYPMWIDERNVDGHSPAVNASKAPGEWQSFDIEFRAPVFDATGKKIRNARFVKVVHNGKTVHQDVELKGPTRAGLWEDEKSAGPLMLQGDHGPVAYRNLAIRPLPKK